MAPIGLSRLDPAPASEPPLVLDIAGQRVELTRPEAMRLRDGATAQAGRSSCARDLSLLLDRALASPQTLALRRSELRVLIRLAEAGGLTELAARLDTRR